MSSGLQTPTSAEFTFNMEDLSTNPSLDDLQTNEQRRVLDTVAKVRKCGLESILSLPQLVVCGDQSAGKSSVLEALTEIPFPRNENLCTRYATEIILRRGPINYLTIGVIPHDGRSPEEQVRIKDFKETITDFKQLPEVMEKAMEVMGIASGDSSSSGAGAFARDVLSIEIEGPNRPQLTLVDIPGLIRTATGIVTDSDIDLVAQITEHYISNERTICLAVVAASADYATQEILKKVLKVDPEGKRTLGIITKPDRIDGAATKQAFSDLAQNQDPKVLLKLGWHVLRNRGPQEAKSSLEDRKIAEAKWFREDPIFKLLAPAMVGIDSLRRRLSILLFQHVKRELPQLREDLENALEAAESDLAAMGKRRSTAQECKEYLSQLSMDFHSVCKAAVDGHYEGVYFRKSSNQMFDLTSSSTFCRARAAVQSLNSSFADDIRTKGQKYIIDMDDHTKLTVEDIEKPRWLHSRMKSGGPHRLNRADAISWVHQLLSQTRGKELPGNFNPLLIGELFWEQSSKWGFLASSHVDTVSEICSSFLNTVLEDKCPKDVQDRIWESIKEKLKARRENAVDELAKLTDDLANYPINYNHYYTNTINKRREERQSDRLRQSLEAGTTRPSQFDFNPHPPITTDFNEVVASYSKASEADMEKVSCEEALDALFAIYKVLQKTFVANVTTQVIERHIVRGLETIFSPLVVNRLSDEEALSIASEPMDIGQDRAKLEDKIAKLKEGHEAFRSVMGVTVR